MAEILKNRDRICKLCALREIYEKKDGTLGHRCASEPQGIYEQLR